ncbi:MAG: Beta-glucosidase, partial [Cyanobacteria bacterium RYN_339]|nr:Beta-glucosidase [Cyanobacteria bacterium RYN_339]
GLSMKQQSLFAAALLASSLLAACGQPAAQLVATPATAQAAQAAQAVQPTVTLIKGRAAAGFNTEINPAAAPEMPVEAMRTALLQDSAPAALPAQVAFPAKFLWGAATAAHQVEGHLNNDWTGEYETTPGHIKNGDTSTVGVDFYNRFDSDFGLAQGMGHNSHRLSVEWSRIEPQRGVHDAAAIAHYHAVFASMKAHGLKPMVTLHHFTSPKWVAAQGGWLADQTIGDFARFAAFMGLEYGGEVDSWIPVNEPNVYAFNSYESGQWPPMHKDREEALKVMANLAKGHAAAYHALHAADQDDADGDGINAEVGTALHIALFDAARWYNPIDIATAYFNDKVFNRAFLKAVTAGELDFSIPGSKGVKGKWADATNTVDFLGFNYYTRWCCKGGDRAPKAGAPVTAMGWENYPEGMYRAAKLVNSYHKLPDGRRVPLMITENGIDDRTGADRNAYTVQHLQQVARAIKDGVDVRGYMTWTLMDNFEWADGYTPKFGLYTVDRAHNLARVATPTVALFTNITAANGLTADMITTYGTK